MQTPIDQTAHQNQSDQGLHFLFIWTTQLFGGGGGGNMTFALFKDINAGINKSISYHIN